MKITVIYNTDIVSGADIKREVANKYLKEVDGGHLHILERDNIYQVVLDLNNLYANLRNAQIFLDYVEGFPEGKPEIHKDSSYWDHINHKDASFKEAGNKQGE
tara:strand:- start:3571 stop:3879 length:309 start_codon:yes stop_codon:yes gene_type:complete